MKFLKFAAAALAILPICMSARAARDMVGIYVSDKLLDEQGIIENDTTLVPIRIINDALGLGTEWNGERQCVTIDFGGGKLCDMYIGGRYAYIVDNGEWRECELTAEPVIENIGGGDRTVVPVRFISEEMGMDVIWEDVNRTVYINSGAAHDEYVSSGQRTADLYNSRAPYALMSKDGADEYVLWSDIDSRWHDSWTLKNYTLGLDGLSSQIDEYISNKSGSWGVYIKNLTNGEFMVLNDGRYASASVIKLFVMAGTYNEIAAGCMSKTAEVDEFLTHMITESDNYSANRLVYLMGQGNYERGFNAENAHTNSIGALNTQHKSLFIGYGDYVSYGQNLVSPVDCGILLEKIYNGELVSRDASAEMLSLLKRQQRRWKIPYPLPGGVVTANKTGETSTVESDTAIVYSPSCDYVICVLTNNAPDGVAGIRRISKMTYDYFNP